MWTRGPAGSTFVELRVANEQLAQASRHGIHLSSAIWSCFAEPCRGYPGMIGVLWLNRADDTSNDAAGYMYVNHEIGGCEPAKSRKHRVPIYLNGSLSLRRRAIDISIKAPGCNTWFISKIARPNSRPTRVVLHIKRVILLLLLYRNIIAFLYMFFYIVVCSQYIIVLPFAGWTKKLRSLVGSMFMWTIITKVEHNRWSRVASRDTSKVLPRTKKLAAVSRRNAEINASADE